MVDVDLGQLDRAGEVAGHALERRAHHATRATPGSPEVDEYWRPRPLNDLREAVVAGVDDPRQRPMARRTSRRTRGRSRYPVALPAVRTGDDTRFHAGSQGSNVYTREDAGEPAGIPKVEPNMLNFAFYGLSV